jgi:hypothetical protein
MTIVGYQPLRAALTTEQKNALFTVQMEMCNFGAPANCLRTGVDPGFWGGLHRVKEYKIRYESEHLFRMRKESTINYKFKKAEK